MYGMYVNVHIRQHHSTRAYTRTQDRPAAPRQTSGVSQTQTPHLHSFLILIDVQPAGIGSVGGEQLGQPLFGAAQRNGVAAVGMPLKGPKPPDPRIAGVSAGVADIIHTDDEPVRKKKKKKKKRGNVKG